MQGAVQTNGRKAMLQVHAIMMVLAMATLLGSCQAQDKGNHLILGSWSFNDSEGNVASDVSAATAEATLVGASWCEGVYGTGISFDGIDDYVEFTSETEVVFSRNFSIAVWLKPLTIRGTQGIVVKRDIAQSEGIAVAFRSGFLSFEFFDQSGNMRTVSVGMADAAENWMHICVTVSPPNVAIYVNGVLAIQDEFSSFVEILHTSSGLNLGRWNDYPGKMQFGGCIDELLIYGDAMEDVEVYNLFAQNEVGN
jgi:hypothetical protein